MERFHRLWNPVLDRPRADAFADDKLCCGFVHVALHVGPADLCIRVVRGDIGLVDHGRRYLRFHKSPLRPERSLTGTSTLLWTEISIDPRSFPLERANGHRAGENLVCRAKFQMFYRWRGQWSTEIDKKCITMESPLKNHCACGNPNSPDDLRSFGRLGFNIVS